VKWAGAVVALALGVTACAPAPAQESMTAEVVLIDTESLVEASGPIEAVQNADLFWRTTGNVATVEVAIGDQVKTGDVLMTLDITSAPQTIFSAQAELLTAQDNLNNLLNPAAKSIADAEKAVAAAQDELERAQRNLGYIETPDVNYYQDQVTEAQEALTQAQNNAEITEVGSANQAVIDGQRRVEDTLGVYNELKQREALYPGCCGSRVEDAYNNWQRAIENLRVAELQLVNAQANNQDAIEAAQETLEDAQGNLAWATNVDQTELINRRADVAVAEAKLAEAQDILRDLQNGGDPTDVATARARVEAAQATVDQLMIRAPFDGEVLVLNYLPGDPVVQTQAAVVLANRSDLHVDVSVDETDITSLAAGDPVTVTFDPIADLELPGTVAQINPVGQTVQGLVRYTVRVDLNEIDPRVLLGMTADVSIVTDAERGVLAVPLDAVQSDDQGEYVNRIKADGTSERVPVETGEVQGGLVLIRGSLSAGDTVQIPAPQEAPSGGPFGG
jgi:HlyD family secretion protein